MPVPTRLLFVCLGNICRSPAAEGVMRRLVADAGLSKIIEVDSAGTAGWHKGNLADPRMRQAASRRGITLDHRARQVRATDFEAFDLILVMDEENRRDLRDFASHQQIADQVRLLTDYQSQHDATHVPDPYYGGEEDFEQVLDLLEDTCAGLLETLRRPADPAPTST
ncbi:MAG: low molecular weight phosphotyrosine protein phosphatase [Verrucomicrobiales bacterium]|nr:low molecular weight phosphotyrosine protein phosphatase [Verrucomicrobiales bacterium]